MSTKIDQIIWDFENKYWAPDGLARLDEDDKHPPFMGRVLPTVANENGILYLAEIMLELNKLGRLKLGYLDRVISTLMDLTKPGSFTFDRRPGQDMLNSHDNLIGIILLCQIFGFKEILEGLYEWGSEHRWNFNNTNPDKYFDFRAWIQPRDQALIRMATGRPAGRVSWLWLWGSRFTKSKHKRMMRLRMESLRISYNKYHKVDCHWLMRSTCKWYESWGGDKRFAKECGEYYKDVNHPYRRLCEEST